MVVAGEDGFCAVAKARWPDINGERARSADGQGGSGTVIESLQMVGRL